MLRRARSWKVASSPSRRAMSPLVQFLGAEHREVDAGPPQQLDQRAQAALPAQVERGIAEPEQQVAFALLREQRQRQVRGPVDAAGGRTAAGIVGRRAVPPAPRRPCRGSAPRSSVSKRRRSITASTCSIIIGHSSTQARQVVQAQSVSGWIMARAPIERQQRSAMRLAGDAAGMVVAGIGAIGARPRPGRRRCPGSASSG